MAARECGYDRIMAASPNRAYDDIVELGYNTIIEKNQK